MPAARFSRSGAAPLSRRQPRLKSGSPDVSRYSVQSPAVRNANTRTSGWAVSMLGRAPVFSRRRSQIASFTRSVANSRLLSGDLIAVMSTRSVCVDANQRSHGCSSASA